MMVFGSIRRRLGEMLKEWRGVSKVRGCFDKWVHNLSELILDGAETNRDEFF